MGLSWKKTARSQRKPSWKILRTRRRPDSNQRRRPVLTIHVPRLTASRVASAISTISRLPREGLRIRLRRQCRPWLFASRNNSSVQNRVAYFYTAGGPRARSLIISQGSQQSRCQTAVT